MSVDFEADLFLLSKKFQDDLSIGEMLSLKLRVNLSPTIQMDGEAMEALADYHRMARRISSLKDNPRKWESLIHLTKAFYYGGGYYFFSGANRPHNEDSILTRFISLVEQNALRQRDTAYYAGRLCLTPKYLSRLIKQKTGRTAKEVILNYVSLRSKTLLLNTDLTIQQVADETGFPSQSVFGKFFKRSTGLSPREYRTRHQ